MAETWTTRRLLAWMSEAFTARGLDSPRLMAELLMAHVVGCERMRLYMEADRPASEIERSRLRELVGRALKHEPIQYLVGTTSFYGVTLKVDRRVLIPRQCTGVIVDELLRHARAEPGFGGKTGDGLLIADVCTGSGALAIALAKNLPRARLVASDISADALDVARENATRAGVADRIDFLCGDLLDPIREFGPTRGDGALNYLVSNPPYIPDNEWDAVEANVREYEPEIALRGGADGLKFVRPIIEAGPSLVRSGGLITIEIASATKDAAQELMGQQPGIAAASVIDDLEGHPRVVIGRRATPSA